ncbi:FHA domain-containing protein [Streptomyces sp. B6B3]|uniref:FHA domain-containing protein n=1 Tax=Streptomyces sp. B6B3 TaxID=3153570 RepID=UPI00325DA448
MLTNLGRRPIRFPDSRLVHGGDRAELPEGYTPLFLVSPRQEHLLEVRVAGLPTPRELREGHGVHEERTIGEERELDETEKLVLVCLAQRCPRGEPRPQPLTWAEAADALNALNPPKPWTQKRAAHTVAAVRRRLSGQAGVPGLVAEEVPPPVGNALNHNLITDLLLTASIEKSDLDPLGERSAPRSA